MGYYLSCNFCGKRITKILNKRLPLPDFKESIDKPLLESGQYCTDPESNFLVSISDKHDLHYHSDRERMIGCCGPPLHGLPNLVCGCKAEIGREVTDCNDPHFILFKKEKAKLNLDHDRLLERILQSDTGEDEKSALETLLLYGQLDDLKEKLDAFSKSP